MHNNPLTFEALHKFKFMKQHFNFINTDIRNLKLRLVHVLKFM